MRSLKDLGDLGMGRIRAYFFQAQALTISQLNSYDIEEDDVHVAISRPKTVQP